MPVRINMLGLLCLLVVASSAAVGQHPYRPVPSQQQTYHKPHDWAPGVSVVTPSFDYLPANPEAVCSECRERPILDAVDHWSERWAPWVVGPALLDKAEAKLGLQDARYHAYGGAEFILWNTNSPSVAPLITTSPAGTPQAQAGVLGQPGTSTLFGGGLYDDTRPGGRYTAALVVDGQSRWIIEGIYTQVGEDERFFRADSSRADIIARPFFNVTNGAEDARLVVFPGLSDGRVDIQAKTSMDTFQIALRRALGEVLGLNADYIVGYRQADLDDSLQIFDVTNVQSGATQGSRFEVRDTFRTDNRFQGLDLGVIMRWRKSQRLSVDFLAKAALGRTESDIVIDGRTITRPAGGTRTGAAGGLLALPSNIGRYHKSDFATVIELGATLRYQVRDNIQATLGYTFLTWSDVARVADQLDRNVNTTQLPPGPLTGAARPAFAFDSSDFTAQGLRAGIQISF